MAKPAGQFKVEVTWLWRAALKLVTPEGKIVFIDPWLKNNRGEFEVTVGDEQKRLVPGEGTVSPGDVRHTLTTGPDSRLIELWYPVKQA